MKSVRGWRGCEGVRALRCRRVGAERGSSHRLRGGVWWLEGPWLGL